MKCSVCSSEELFHSVIFRVIDIFKSDRVKLQFSHLGSRGRMDGRGTEGRNDYGPKDGSINRMRGGLSLGLSVGLKEEKRGKTLGLLPLLGLREENHTNHFQTW